VGLDYFWRPYKDLNKDVGAPQVNPGAAPVVPPPGPSDEASPAPGDDDLEKIANELPEPSPVASPSVPVSVSASPSPSPSTTVAPFYGPLPEPSHDANIPPTAPIAPLPSSSPSGPAKI
jgi:hypothetical protein